MENYNFLPETYNEMRRIKKIKKYKVIILVLWLISLILFAVYTFNSNRNKLINENIKSDINSKMDKVINANKQQQSDNNTLAAFKSFYEDIYGKLSYNTAIINNNGLNLELTIGEREQYYQIVSKFENMPHYYMSYVSPLSYDNNIYKFRMILEVRP